MELRSAEEQRERAESLKYPERIYKIGLRDAEGRTLTNAELVELEAYYNSCDNTEQKEFLCAYIAHYYQLEESVGVTSSKKAIEWWKKLLHTEYKFEATIGIGDSYSSLKEYVEAIRWYNEALALTSDTDLKAMTRTRIIDCKEQPRIVEAIRYAEVDELVREGKYKEALKRCVELETLYPESKSVHFRKAHVYGRLKKPREAIKEFKKSK